ncbi:MAG: 4'-phosphopantetheinyl transferase superfamily protein [Gemmatimonadota bacterium]
MTRSPDIHVWLVDLEDEGALALADSGLPDELDHRRAASINDPEAARRLLARRAAVKAVAAEALSEDPGDFRIVRAPGGKPVIVSKTSKAPALSVAHAGRLLSVAVSTAVSIGVDVERVRPVHRARQIARKWFDAREAQELEGVDEHARTDAFFRMWTAKEALAKRHGAGLRLMRGQKRELDVREAIATGTLRYFDVSPGYVAAVASTDTVGEIRVVQPEMRRWTT